tara:strand:+ start:1454 stop:1582 length:129 start_codon:yes stop_codon:yes gene_type:complete
MKNISNLEVQIILLIEKYEKLNINQNIIIDLKSILLKTNEDG